MAAGVFDPSCRDLTWRVTDASTTTCQPGRADVKLVFGPVACIVHRQSHLFERAVPDPALDQVEADMGGAHSAVRHPMTDKYLNSRTHDTATTISHTEAKIADICLSFGEEISGWKPAKHWSCYSSISSSPKQCHTDSWGSSRRAAWGSTELWISFDTWAAPWLPWTISQRPPASNDVPNDSRCDPLVTGKWTQSSTVKS